MELLNGILAAISPMNLLYASVGCLLGTMVGVLPGIGAASALAILFPFTAYLPVTGMLIALAAIYYGCQYGGSTTAILVNVPGEISSMVTALDGYEMTKQGRPGVALAVAALTSFQAGIIGCLLIAFIGPSIARLALSFGPAEFLGLGMFSLTAIAALSGRSLLKGAIVTLVGILLTSVGVDDASSVKRLTFGSVRLLEGFALVPVVIGLFGVAEVLRALQEQTSELITSKLGRLLPNWSESKASLGASTRATGVGLFLGLFPGMGPSIASFLAYAVERNYSRTPEKFGKGAIEGVASSEAANNAAAMSNLIPLLSLGVPTGPSAALLIGAFMMAGITPGPLLFTQHADLAWTLIGSFFIANVILLILNLPLVGLWARMATIPYPILAPIILLLCLVGAYATRNSMVDVWVCAIFGLVGWAMNKGGWPTAPMVLAYVVGPIIENSSRRVLAVSPALLLERPVFWLFILMAVAAAWISRRLLSRNAVA